MDPFCFFLRFVSVMPSCLFIAAFWSPAGKRAHNLTLLYVMVSCAICHFSMWCPGSGVVLDCNVS